VSPPGTPLPEPRAWIGNAPFPWPPAASLAGGAAVNACYALVSVTTLRTRQEKPYLKLQLVDCHGPLEGRVWDGAAEVAARLRAGIYVGVRGRLEIFNGERQLKIDEIAQLRVPLDDLELFLPRSRRPAAAMNADLVAFIESVSDVPLRTLLQRMLSADSEVGHGFRLAPAAKYNHHAWLGGLLEHTLSVTTVCDGLARHYGDAIDRDLLITAALLHDIGKVREIGAQAGFPYTDEGKLLGHILLGLQMVHAVGSTVPGLSAERLLLVEHLIASHQGRYEWQSPREPRILEGLVLHYADDLDAKVAQAGALIAGTAAGWTAWDRSFQREFLRHRRDETAEPPPDAEADVAPAEGPAPVAGEQSDTRAKPRPSGPAGFDHAGDSLDLFEDG
jgi:3'-5' exoribonuclease